MTTGNATKRGAASLRIQLAFQGGGAKLFALIAAAEAIKDFERRGELSVVRIAGTSAGAIIGALYAAGVEPREMRAEFAGFDASSVAPRPPRLVPACLHVAWVIARAARNKPIGNAKPLRKFFESLLRRGLGDKQLVFGSLATPLVIMAADVGKRGKQVYKEPHESVVQAMLNSCALPFFFSTAQQSEQSLILDGGLSANLPSDELDPADGPIIALSFFESESGSPPQTSWELAKSLLATAIDSSVERARSRAGIYVIPLNARGISTFDFEPAQRELRSEGPIYLLARREAADRLHEFVEANRRKAQVLTSNIWHESDPDLMERLTRIYRSQSEGRLFRYLYHLVVLRAESLWPDSEAGLTHDQLTQVVRIQPTSWDIDVIRLHVLVRPEEIGFVSCSVTNEAGKAVQIEYLPVVDESPALLVCFTPPLPALAPQWVEVTVHYKLRDSMSDLRMRGRDELVLMGERVDGVTERAEFVLLVPEAFGAVRLEEPPQGETRVHPGCRLPHGGHASGLTPQGFRYYGWCCDKVPADKVLKAYVSKA